MMIYVHGQCINFTIVKGIRKDKELKQSEPKSSPQNQSGK